jgi:release factor glutamine methyltransferase
MKLKELKDIFNKELRSIYSINESETILSYVLIDAIGIPKLTIISQPQLELDPNQSKKALQLLTDLKKGIPIQHLLGTAHFYGMILHVTPDVLIPRQETEELVDWVIKDHQGSNVKILDVCTGSGCIALALKKHLPESEITAIDISDKALKVAKKNADALKIEVTLKKTNALQLEKELKNDTFDIIISNPPYIPKSEKDTVQKSVYMYEPHLALFVVDETPFIFYESIVRYATKSKPVTLYFEINEDKSEDLTQLLRDMGIREIILKKDLNGKKRMLKCSYF